MTTYERYVTKLETLLDDAREKVAASTGHAEIMYWRGVLFGLETALAELKLAGGDEGNGKK